MLPDIAALSMHRSGSLVVQRLLDYCDEDGKALAVNALLQGEDGCSIVEIACSHYGSYVIEQVAGLRQLYATQTVAFTLASNLHHLHISDHASRVVVAFGLGVYTECS